MIFLYIGLGILGGIAVVLFLWFSNNALKTTHYAVFADVEKDIKIVHISDLHAKNFGRNNSRLLKRILKESPDFIAVTGDIINKYRKKEIDTALKFVSAASGIAPVLFVSGNHEMRKTKYRALRKQLLEAGAVVLDDCSTDICGLTVTGLNCSSLKNGTMSRIKPVKGYTLLLAHMPHYLKSYASAGYDLVLTGHAHGGQWRIPFTGIGIYSPGQGLFPALTSGVKSEGETKMVISRGLGNSRCPLRLFNRPEVVVVDLKKKV